MMREIPRIVVLAGALVLGGVSFAEACVDDCDPPPPPPPSEKVKGNNGWGNGPDTTNPGSFSGKTAPSKSTNGAVNGRQPKFEGR